MVNRGEVLQRGLSADHHTDIYGNDLRAAEATKTDEARSQCMAHPRFKMWGVRW